MRQLKREVKIGNVTIGGNNPIAVQTMLQTGRLKIYKDCKHTLEEFGVYAWDPDKDDTVLKVNDHCMDAIRYFVRTKRLVKLRN